MGNITLVCWSCGKKMVVKANRAPDFGFELMELAAAAGMKSYHDPIYGRVLVFCDEICAKSQLTKTGRFRLRPKKGEGEHGQDK